MQTYSEWQAGNTDHATEELDARLNELRNSVEEAECKVEAFKAENKLIDLRCRLITDDEIQRVNDQLTAACALTLELNSRTASIRDFSIEVVVISSRSEAICSPAITEFRSQYAALIKEADHTAVRLVSRYLERQTVEVHLYSASKCIATELRCVTALIQVELKFTVQTEQWLVTGLTRLKVRHDSISDEKVKMLDLERDVAAKFFVYRDFSAARSRNRRAARDQPQPIPSDLSSLVPLESNGLLRAMIALNGAFIGFVAGVGIDRL